MIGFGSENIDTIIHKIEMYLNSIGGSFVLYAVNKLIRNAIVSCSLCVWMLDITSDDQQMICYLSEGSPSNLNGNRLD